MSPSISVVIPTYNSPAFVVSAVESVLRQELEPAGIIVVEDGSTDGTAEALGPYRQLIRSTSRSRTVVRPWPHGVAAAQSAWIAFLNAEGRPFHPSLSQGQRKLSSTWSSSLTGPTMGAACEGESSVVASQLDRSLCFYGFETLSVAGISAME